MVFLFRSEIFFSDNTRVRIFFFVVHSANFFFQNLTLGYMTKFRIRLFFFPPPKSEYFFQQHWEFFFFKKNHTPPPLSLQVKWVVPNQMYILYNMVTSFIGV